MYGWSEWFIVMSFDMFRKFGLSGRYKVTIKVLFNEKQYFNVKKKTEGERNRPVLA